MTSHSRNGNGAPNRSLATSDQPLRSQLVIEVTFDRPDRCYAPGESLTASARVLCPGTVIRALEQSVVWYTEGKGEEDLGVHRFERVTDRRLLATHPVEATFTTKLPASPLSYEGVIVKIRWCVRVRVFFQGTRDFVSEHVFQVGSVPPARPLRPPAGMEPPS